MTRWIAMVFVALAVTQGAHAQKLYRCGNTFSQIPCGADAQEMKAAGVPQPVPTSALEELTPERYAELRAICEAGVRSIPAWKDPDSVKIGAVRRGNRTIAMDFASGRRRAVAPWFVTVNARNGFGGYGGEKVAQCYFDPAESKLLDVYVPRD